MKVKVFVLSIALLALSACVTPPQYKDDPIIPGGNDTIVKCSPDTVYFVNAVLPIFKSSCAYSGCHDAVSAQKGVILDSYNNIVRTGDVVPGNPDKSDVYEVLIETDPKKRMPYQLPKLPDNQIETIRKWIAQGALNNECKSACDTLNITWNSAIKSIMDRNCIACHGNIAPSAGINLTQYSNVKPLAINGKLYGVTAWLPGFKPMPPSGSKIDNCSINQIRIWAANGAPEN